MLGRLDDKYGLPRLNARLAAKLVAWRCFDRYSEWAAIYLDKAGPTGVDLLLLTAKALEAVEPKTAQHP
jgi:hypothetical protein